MGQAGWNLERSFVVGLFCCFASVLLIKLIDFHCYGCVKS